MTGTSHGNVFDYFNTFSAVLDWWFSSKPECHFFRQFLTAKNLHIINLGMKECFKCSNSLGSNSNGRKRLTLVEVSCLYDL